MAALNRRLAGAIFAILILAAVLLFGAVDRLVQLSLVFGLGVGFLLVPPELPRLPRGWAWAVLAFAGFVMVSQFLPGRWFRETEWHRLLSHDYGVVFPLTRNPEPGRAVDCIFTGLMAVGWFFWVRTLAGNFETRAYLVWALFCAATVVAGVSLALGTRNDYFIYGYRYSPGWTGFGPFPNRNHTAALLAMGALAGSGCLVWAARRHAWGAVAVAAAGVVTVVMALLESKSRGGLLGLGCGAALFATLAVLKVRSRGAVAGALAGVLLCVTLVLSFGSKVLSRFEGTGDGTISNNLRWAIWEDAVTVWKDAPLWGHGLGTFGQIYPVYQTVRVPNEVVLHPESSWLLWLVELGAVPVLVGAGAFLFFFGKYLAEAVQGADRGFFLRAGAFAGVFGLVCHSLWDVPSHRWGTAAFGLALLAVACPPLRRSRQVRLDRLVALVPLLIGTYWVLPYQQSAPAWSADAEKMLLTRLAYAPASAPLGALKQVEAVFPLSSDLHQQIGIREMVVAQSPPRAWKEFRIADRLAPGSWALPATQGWVSREASPGMALHFWSVAIERADRRGPEIFGAVYRNTQELPGAADFWRGYGINHPAYLLVYSELEPDQARAREAFETWWKERGSTGAELESWEAEEFYVAERKWGDAAQMLIWMERHHGLEAADYRTWASIFHDWRLDADAWKVLSRRIPEPAFPAGDAGVASPAALESHWMANPNDPVWAQAYARQCALRGDAARSEQVVLTVAAGKNAPRWFREKAAFLYAARGDYTTAVNTLLNGEQGTGGGNG